MDQCDFIENCGEVVQAQVGDVVTVVHYRFPREILHFRVVKRFPASVMAELEKPDKYSEAVRNLYTKGDGSKVQIEIMDNEVMETK